MEHIETDIKRENMKLWVILTILLAIMTALSFTLKDQGGVLGAIVRKAAELF